MTLPFHPLADIFPLIEGAEFDDLVEDIRINGIRDEIVMHEGAVLDGRNRYRALLELQRTGEVRGPGWGAYANEPVTDEDLAPDASLPWFVRFSPMLSGDPLAFVISKNLKRRHLDDRQRASVAGKIANLSQGGDRSKPPIGGMTVQAAASTLNVAPRQVERARVVHETGVPELRQALDRGELPVSTAEKIARLPEQQQPEELARVLPNGARAIMSSRQEPDDSLDYFPTPPWATRALMERVLCGYWNVPRARLRSADEPACGEGHMAEVLREYFADVRATDVHDYGYGGIRDFLSDDESDYGRRDWIITNPPFNDKSERFVLAAIERACVGVAMFLRLQWLETVGRYERIFAPHPPALIAQFSERVPLCKGRWNPDGDTATAYLWLVWTKAERSGRTEFFWIPPGCREQLTMPDDVERFTARPVIKKQHRIETPSPPVAPPSPPRFKSPLDDSDPFEIPPMFQRGHKDNEWMHKR